MDGAHSVYFKVTDDAGNVNPDSCVNSWSFTYDGTPPEEADVISPEPDLYFNYLPTMEIRFMDNLGLDRAYYQMDGCEGTWTALWPDNSASFDTTVLQIVPDVPDGSHAVYFKVTDDAGNVNSDSCLNFWSFTYDGTPPAEANVLSPESDLTFNHMPTLEVQFTDNVGLDRAYYQIDGCAGSWTAIWPDNSGSSDTTAFQTVPPMPEGSYAIYFKVTDDAGNVNTDSCLSYWSFAYDITPPEEAHVLSPDSGLIFNQLPVLEIRFVDNVGLDRAYLQIDGCDGDWTALWSDNSGASDTTIQQVVPSVPDGSHTVYFKVTDDGGNVNIDSCLNYWSFTYDGTPPEEPTVLSPPQGGSLNYLPELQIRFEDAMGLDRAYYQINACDGEWIELWSHNSNATDTNISWQIPGIPEGEQFYYFKVTDDAGNSNVDTCSYSWYFTYDITPPASPANFLVEPGHEMCLLSWQNPTGDPSFDGVEIRRNPWATGAYPEYDDAFPDPVGYAETHTQGWFVYRASGESHFDSPTGFPRNVYYYSIFSFDLAGNYSILAPGDTVRATNYWLGDVDKDGEIGEVDLDVFSNTFGTTSADPEYNNEFDIGPTYDMSPHGIPTTDDRIDFEDLMVFAINYGQEIPTASGDPLMARHLHVPASDSTAASAVGRDGSVALVPDFQTDLVGDIDTIWVQLEGDLQDVKGAFFKITYDEDFITPTEVIDGPDMPAGVFTHSAIYSQDSIVLNLGILEGDFDAPGSILGIVFSADSTTVGTDLDFEQAILRDWDNQDCSFSTVGAAIRILNYTCGDVEGSGEVDIDDVVYLIQYIFGEGPPPEPVEAANVDCSIDVDIDDVVYLIQYIFTGGNAPCDMDGDGVPNC
jgi:hypothetical protein